LGYKENDEIADEGRCPGCQSYPPQLGGGYTCYMFLGVGLG